MAARVPRKQAASSPNRSSYRHDFVVSPGLFTFLLLTDKQIDPESATATGFDPAPASARAVVES